MTIYKSSKSFAGPCIIEISSNLPLGAIEFRNYINWLLNSFTKWAWSRCLDNEIVRCYSNHTMFKHRLTQ